MTSINYNDTHTHMHTHTQRKRNNKVLKYNHNAYLLDGGHLSKFLWFLLEFLLCTVLDSR